MVAAWFNTAAFARTNSAARSFDGTAGRNIMDGPGLKNVDMGIFREFRITESKKLQFRAESTNALNMVNLSNPGTNADSVSNFGIITTAATDAAGPTGPASDLLTGSGADILAL